MGTLNVTKPGLTVRSAIRVPTAPAPRSLARRKEIVMGSSFFADESTDSTAAIGKVKAGIAKNTVQRERSKHKKRFVSFIKVPL